MLLGLFVFVIRLVGHMLVNGSPVYLVYVVIWVGLDLSLSGVL